MSQREQYTKQKLYEEAFSVSFDWERFLSPNCYEFHDLTCRETNSPISLQMGVMLPFVSACLGPSTRGCFLTRPSVLNLFWLNVAASGVGKSETRKRLVSEPLEYIFSQPDAKMQDFEVSKFTRAGIEDKLISTGGYCIMITDEGASFLGDLKRYETKHESYISLLNQLFDGKGDKMTLAKNVERPVPRNSTSLSIGVQQKSYCDAIHGLTETLWLDNGFGERFIFTAARPYRHKWKTNKEAAKKLMSKFDENIVGKVLHAILTHHFESGIHYELSEEAEEMFEVIIDNYNSQFNLKYSTSSSQITSSQPELDTSEREDIFVRTKAAELVGRIACVLSIYCNAFESVASGRPIHIPKIVTGEYIRHAEEIVSISYTQSEKFSSAIFTQQQAGMVHLSKPKPSDRERVVQGIIRSSGIAVSVRTLAKNIRHVGTEALKYELKKLEAEGFGRYVDRTEMQKDKILPANNCYSVFIKRDILDLPEKFFTLANSSECTQDMYITNYDKQMDVNSKKVTAVYHGNKDRLMLSVDSQMSDSTAAQHVKELNEARKRKFGYRTPPRTKLDSLLSNEKNLIQSSEEENSIKDGDYVSSSEDVEDILFQKVIQPSRTGNFDLDFPASPKVSKGGKIKTTKKPHLKLAETKSTFASKLTHAQEREKVKDAELQQNEEEDMLPVESTCALSNSTEIKDSVQNMEKDNTTGNELQGNDGVSDLDLEGNIRPSGTVTNSKMTGTTIIAEGSTTIQNENLSGLETTKESDEVDRGSIMITKEKSVDISVPRTNAKGQVKTSRNLPRPKPPLPPMKKKHVGPLRRSSRQRKKKEAKASTQPHMASTSGVTRKSRSRKRPLEGSQSEGNGNASKLMRTQ